MCPKTAFSNCIIATSSGQQSFSSCSHSISSVSQLHSYTLQSHKTFMWLWVISNTYTAVTTLLCR